MISSGYKTDLWTYTVLLGGAQTKEELHRLVRNMMTDGIQMDAHAFSAVLKVVRKVYPGRYQEAEALLQAVLKENMKMDERMCTSMLFVFRDSLQVRKAAEFFLKMTNTQKIRPSESSINAILDTASRTTTTPGDEAFRIAKWIWKYGIVNSIVTHHSYGFMMKVYLASQQPQMVFSIFNQLTSNSKVRMTLVHYQYLIEAHRRTGNTDAVANIQRKPHYVQLLNGKNKMTSGRINKQNKSPLTGILSSSPVTAPEKKKEENPSRENLESIRDPLGKQLSRVADLLEERPQIRETKTFAIDDVLRM